MEEDSATLGHRSPWGPTRYVPACSRVPPTGAGDQDAHTGSRVGQTSALPVPDVRGAARACGRGTSGTALIALLPRGGGGQPPGTAVACCAGDSRPGARVWHRARSRRLAQETGEAAGLGLLARPPGLVTRVTAMSEVASCAHGAGGGSEGNGSHTPRPVAPGRGRGRSWGDVPGGSGQQRVAVKGTGTDGRVQRNTRIRERDASG